MKVSIATLSLLLLPSVAAQLPTFLPTVLEDSNSTQLDDELASMITESGKSKAPTYAPEPSLDNDSSGQESSSSSFVAGTPVPVPSPYNDGATPSPSSGEYSSASSPYDDSNNTSTSSSPVVNDYSTSSNTVFPTNYPETSSEGYQTGPSSFVTVEEISSFPTAGDEDDWYSNSAASTNTSEYSSESTNTKPLVEDGSSETVVAAAQSANGAATCGAFSYLLLGFSCIFVVMN